MIIVIMFGILGIHIFRRHSLHKNRKYHGSFSLLLDSYLLTSWSQISTLPDQNLYSSDPIKFSLLCPLEFVIHIGFNNHITFNKRGSI